MSPYWVPFWASLPSLLVTRFVVVLLLQCGVCLSIGERAYLIGIAAERVVNGRYGLRNKLFSQMIKQDIAYHDKLGSGMLLTRFASDTEVVKDALTTYIPLCLEAGSCVSFVTRSYLTLPRLS